MVVSNDSSSSGEEREALEVMPAPEVTPTPTPVTPLPPPASMETILARLALQEAAQKAVVDQITAIAKILAPIAANAEASTAQYRRHLFATERTTNVAPTLDNDNQSAGNDINAHTASELAALKQSVLDINSKIHQVTTSVPQIEHVLAESLRTPFTQKVTGVRLQKMEKLRLPTFKGLSDPYTHVTSFNIAMRRANLTDEDKDAGFCQLFVETLEGPALTWFTGLRENSVDCFHDLSTAFLKNYIMFTNQEATVSDLWNLTHASVQSLRDFMQKFKAIVSKIDIPDHIAVESLMNTLHVDSTFRQNLYRYPTKSVSDAIARSHNFIRMEEDTRAKFAKEAAAKQRPARTNDTRPEPRQHSSGGNTTQKRGYVSSVGDEESPKSAAITREKGWNHWDRDSAPKQSSSSEPASSNSEEPKKWCLYHKRDSHDTKECKVLIGQFFDRITNGTIQMPTSPTTPKNTKSWSKNKEKKAQKSQKNTAPSEERASPERTPVNNIGPANDSSEDEHPRHRRRVEVILSRPCDSSDDDVPTVQPDLRDKLDRKDKQSLTPSTTEKDLRILLKRRSTTNENTGTADLRTTNSKCNARRVGQIGDLRNQLNSKADDLRIQLNQTRINASNPSPAH
ncbi:uncharacterized protein LOC125585926 [Brassica napus]|uniref:uncharacterized protein LOC125585926 n=1 Tax=Brassica napus TaxID=3708 RepID=UPI00207A2197|nr:uncharacterized protein LOC125585926 [Brassica napus]